MRLEPEIELVAGRASRIRNLGTRCFHAPNDMPEYTIVHLIFRVPQVVVWKCVYTNVYLAMYPEPNNQTTFSQLCLKVINMVGQSLCFLL